MRIRLKHRRLLELLADSALSQNHWAIKLGLSSGHWSGIVNGKHPYPSKKTRDLMLETFGVLFEELFYHESKSKAETDFQSALSDRYLLEKELGHGGMGTVYLARDIKHGRLVAVKVVSQEAVCGIGVDRFLKEIRYTARLEHPNVLPLHDSGLAAGHPFYVMPYIRGGSLRDRLNKETRLSLAGVLSVIRGVSAALTYAHDRQVVHCDVKPENILLADDHAYVADFGISRAIHTEVFEWGTRREIDASAGTPAYVSPEQATGEFNLDARSDVYSLGCVVFEMLSGEKPFEGANTMDIVSMRFRETVPDLGRRVPHMPRAVCTAVAHAMALDRDKRTRTTREFVDAVLRGSQQRKSSLLEVVRPITMAAWSLGRRVLGLKRKTRRGTIMETMWQDLRHSARRLARAPAFTITAMLILALGIGGNVVIFSVLKALLLQPLPFPEPDRLVHVWQTDIDARTQWPLTTLDYLDVRELCNSFEEFGAYVPQWFTIGGVEPERVFGASATAGALRTYGVEPAVGRLFTEREEFEANNRLTVLSHGFWERRLGADPNVIGTTVFLNGGAYRILGIMPEGFEFFSPWSPGEDVALWTPLALSIDGATRTDHWLVSIARLRQEATLERAEAELRAIASNLGEQYPTSNARIQLWLNPLKRQIVDDGMGQVLLLMGGVALVLLLACANVASMLLAKNAGRQTEIAIRATLGAGKRRVIGQLLTESMLLSLLGGLTGVLLGAAWFRVVKSTIPADLPRMNEVAIDGPVLLFSLGLALSTSLIFGLAPALQVSRSDLSEALRGGRGAQVTRSGRLRLLGFLAAGQLAIAMVLTNGAVLLYVSLRNVTHTPQAFDSVKTLTASISLDGEPYVENQARVDFWNELLEAVASLPGVDHAGLTSQLPLLGGMNDEILSEYETFESRGLGTLAEISFVSPDYPGAMGVRLLAGRTLRDGDWLESGHGNVVVNKTLAERYWPGESALGKRIQRNADSTSWTAVIVGVVEDIRQWGPERNPIPEVFFPHDRFTLGRSWLVLHSSGDPLSQIPAVKAEVARLDAGLAITDFRTMEQVLNSTTRRRRFTTRLVGVFGLVALALAAVGVFGMMSHDVAQRTREIGIRAALGADGHRLMSMVLIRTLRVASVGAFLGVGGALLTVRITSRLVFGVNPTAPAFIMGLAVFLLLVAVVAAGIPALRATQVHPVRALQAD